MNQRGKVFEDTVTERNIVFPDHSCTNLFA